MKPPAANDVEPEGDDDDESEIGHVADAANLPTPLPDARIIDGVRVPKSVTHWNIRRKLPEGMTAPLIAAERNEFPVEGDPNSHEVPAFSFARIVELWGPGNYVFGWRTMDPIKGRRIHGVGTPPIWVGNPPKRCASCRADYEGKFCGACGASEDGAAPVKAAPGPPREETPLEQFQRVQREARAFEREERALIMREEEARNQRYRDDLDARARREQADREASAARERAFYVELTKLHNPSAAADAAAIAAAVKAALEDDEEDDEEEEEDDEEPEEGDTPSEPAAAGTAPAAAAPEKTQTEQFVDAAVEKAIEVGGAIAIPVANAIADRLVGAVANFGAKAAASVAGGGASS